jgi:histidinol-phosphatase (PHP family)
LKELISNGKGFEINTGSFRDKPGRSTPSYDMELLKRYKRLGGEIISLGSDSHSLEYIGYKFDYFKELLEEAGFKHTVHFENRKPVFDRL